MMTKNRIPLIGILLLAASHWASAESVQQMPISQQKEPIPDDIWDTIASPFDPISNPPGFTPPPQRIEQMRPQQRLAAPVRRTISPVSQPLPQVAPQQPIVQDLSTPAAPRNRYPAEPITTPAPVTTPPAVPYQLPPQEKTVVAEYPEEYWNCLLNNLQGVGSDVAAKLITRACQKKHPKR